MISTLRTKILSCFLIASSFYTVTNLFAQAAELKPTIYDPNSIQETEISEKVVILKLIDVSQYQQCVRMIFELENISNGFLNNCWFHVSLQDSEHGFLYREQPLLFAEVTNGGRQQLELLCESVGIEEVGFIVLHPQLLEIERVETLASPAKVQIISSTDSDVKVVFNSEIR
jgi:hypothetical protein